MEVVASLGQQAALEVLTFTAAASLVSALAWPITLLQAADMIDSSTYDARGHRLTSKDSTASAYPYPPPPLPTNYRTNSLAHRLREGGPRGPAAGARADEEGARPPPRHPRRLLDGCARHLCLPPGARPRAPQVGGGAGEAEPQAAAGSGHGQPRGGPGAHGGAVGHARVVRRGPVAARAGHGGGPARQLLQPQGGVGGVVRVE